jgi:hypothetical protein
MHATVNGARLYFDVEGLGLVPDGRMMRAKPKLVLLHGGPGFDHTMFKPGFSALADIAQVVYVDHRGNGRSDYGDPATWNLANGATTCAGFATCSASKSLSSTACPSAGLSHNPMQLDTPITPASSCSSARRRTMNGGQCSRRSNASGGSRRGRWRKRSG